MDSKKTTVYDCSILHLPQIHNRAGNLTAVENLKSIPFDIKRVYYLYDVPGGEGRGGHSHKKLQQIVIAASGSFDVILDDSISRKVVHLNRPHLGLHIVPGLWRELVNFSSGAICLVLATELYDERDYIRNYIKFISYKIIS